MTLVDYVYMCTLSKKSVQHLENSYSLVYKILYITHPMNAERCPVIIVMKKIWPHLCSYEYIIWANILSALIYTITHSLNMVEAVKKYIGSAIA